MSDTPSDQRPVEPASSAGQGGGSRVEQPTTIHKAVQPTGDQPTIITGRPPLPASALSDSTYRILEGRVMPGDRLGHFELVEFVGGGGMGRVFRAIDSLLGRTVALKVLTPEQATDPDALQRFQNEAQSSARLDHDNIARAFFIGEDHGVHFIAFEFVEGMNVRLLVERKGPLPLAEAISYTLQVAEALVHADARAVVHRDIKPSNVLITPEGRVKLIDMGLARLRHADPAVADLTASGVTLGTFDYISPEQARDPRNADIRSDIYSLGCTLFFMLSGHPPFPEGTVLQKLLQHQGDQPPEIRETRPDVPDEASRILRKMMAKDPRHRYATPEELATELLLLADRIGLRPMSPTSRVWLTPQESSVSFFQRHLPWIAPVAALVCIVVLLDLFWSSTGQRGELTPPAGVLTEPIAAKPTPKRSNKENASRQALLRSSEDATEVDDARVSDAGIPSPAGPIDAAKNLDQTSKPADAPLKTGPDRQDVAAVEREPAGPSSPKSGSAESRTGVAAVAERPDTPGTEAGKLPATNAVESAPRAADPAVAPSSPKQGLLIVTESPEGEEQFASLGAACSAAHDGDVIELRYNGPREERPVKISNLRVGIRAGEGYEPIVVFRPNEVDPVLQPREMLSLTAGQLSLSGVALELHVPRNLPADGWTLFETRGGATARLERCVLTILNASGQQAAYHQDAAFFRSRAASNADTAIDATRVATPLATIAMADCIARGEADFLRAEDMQPVHLTWDNGLLATTERLVYVASGQTASKPDEELRIELRHVTAVVRGGLCRMLSTPALPHPLSVQVASTNGILLGLPGVPLIEEEGPVSIEALQQRFTWSGQRNVYQGVDVFWTIRSLGTLGTEPVVESLGYDAWQAYWGPSRETRPSIERLFWKRTPEANRPPHAQGPGDYALEDPTFGDSAAGAPGLRADRLPPLPSETRPLRTGYRDTNYGAGSRSAGNAGLGEWPSSAESNALGVDKLRNSASSKP